VSYWDDTLAIVQKQYPKLRVLPIESSDLIRVLDFVAFWADIADDYTITIGNTIYMGPELRGTSRGADILYHEAVHVGQWNKWNVLYYLSYFLCFPTVLTMRAYWEWQAYKVGLQRMLKLRGSIPQSEEDWIVKVFKGSGYLFMFPFEKTLRKWVQNVREGK
jgi:hypothetical protein